MLCLMKMIFLSPGFDKQIYYDDSMPPIYDDYIYESGFGEVMTLFCDEFTITKRFQLIMRTKLLSMMIIVMTRML